MPITRSNKVAKLGSWSPDSNWIVYNIEDSVYLSNPKGVNEIFITKGNNPKWSPNGEYLIFSRLDNQLKSIWIYKNIDKVVENTGKEINKENYFGENIHDNLKVNMLEYDWAFGGNKVLYTNDQENNKEIYIMDVKSKKIERLTNNKVDDLSNPSKVYALFYSFFLIPIMITIFGVLFFFLFKMLTYEKQDPYHLLKCFQRL